MGVGGDGSRVCSLRNILMAAYGVTAHIYYFFCYVVGWTLVASGEGESYNSWGVVCNMSWLCVCVKEEEEGGGLSGELGKSYVYNISPHF